MLVKQFTTKLFYLLYIPPSNNLRQREVIHIDKIFEYLLLVWVPSELDLKSRIQFKQFIGDAKVHEEPKCRE